MSGNFAIKEGGGGRLMANAILNFHFDFWHPSLTKIECNGATMGYHGLPWAWLGSAWSLGDQIIIRVLATSICLNINRDVAK